LLGVIDAEGAQKYLEIELGRFFIVDQVETALPKMGFDKFQRKVTVRGQSVRLDKYSPVLEWLQIDPGKSPFQRTDQKLLLNAGARRQGDVARNGAAA
jgi:hypothetical protein